MHVFRHILSHFYICGEFYIKYIKFCLNLEKCLEFLRIDPNFAVLFRNFVHRKDKAGNSTWKLEGEREKEPFFPLAKAIHLSMRVFVEKKLGPKAESSRGNSELNQENAEKPNRKFGNCKRGRETQNTGRKKRNRHRLEHALFSRHKTIHSIDSNHIFLHTPATFRTVSIFSWKN